MRYFGILFFCVFTALGQQKSTKEGLSIELMGANEVLNQNMLSVLKIKDKRLQKLVVHLSVNSLEGFKADISAFSLVDTINKMRYPVVDYLGYKTFIGSTGEKNAYLTKQIVNKKGKVVNTGEVKYDTLIKNYFDIFSIKGYFDFNFPINTSYSKYNESQVIYFGKTRFDKFTADLTFVIPKDLKEEYYELYYKNEKLFALSFKPRN